MQNRILLALLLGILSLSVQAKPSKTITKVQNGIYYTESGKETLATGVPLISSDGVELSLQAQKPTAKTGEEELRWWLVITFAKAAKEVVIRENSDLLTLNLFDKTKLELRSAHDITGAVASRLIEKTTLVYYYHVIFYAISPAQIEQIINNGVESMQFSYAYDMQSPSMSVFDKSFKKDKVGEALKEMYPAVKAAMDEL